MKKSRLKQDVLESPEGGELRVSWMPGKRVRLTFKESGRVLVGAIFPSPDKTHVVLEYGKK